MTVSIAWITPFEALTSATITFELPFSVAGFFGRRSRQAVETRGSRLQRRLIACCCAIW
jgi:hypothetical protein